MKCGGVMPRRRAHREPTPDSRKHPPAQGPGRGGHGEDRANGAVLPPDEVGASTTPPAQNPRVNIPASLPGNRIQRREEGELQGQLVGVAAARQQTATAAPLMYEYDHGGPSARQPIATPPLVVPLPMMGVTAAQARPPGVGVQPPSNPAMHWACMPPLAMSPTPHQPAPMPLVQRQHAWMQQQQAMATYANVDVSDLNAPSSPQQLAAAQRQQEQAAAEAYSRHFYQAQLYQQQQQQRYEEREQQRRVLAQPLYNPMRIQPRFEAEAETGPPPASCSNRSGSGSCGSCGESSCSNPAGQPAIAPKGHAGPTRAPSMSRLKKVDVVEGVGEVMQSGKGVAVRVSPVAAALRCRAPCGGGRHGEWMGEGEGEVEVAEHGGSFGGETSGGRACCQRGSQTASAFGPSASGRHRKGGREANGAPALRVARLESECVSTSGTGATKTDRKVETVEELDGETLAKTPIFGLSEDLLVSILQMLSTSEWRTVVPCVCKRWKAVVETCDDLWESVEVCPFENSAVARRLSSRPERFWAMEGRDDQWLASSSLSRAKIMRGLAPHMMHIHTLLLSCLALNLTPASYDGHPIASGEARRGEGPSGTGRRPVRIRSTDMSASDLIWMLAHLRTGLRQLVLRVSGEITTAEVIREVCQASSLELLHADLGNVELDCAMLAPLKQLRSLRLKRDELSLDINEGSIKLMNLHRLGECSKLTRLSLGFDTHLEALPPALFNLDKLTMLEVDRCSSMQRLPPAIAKLTSLQTLSLTGSSSLGELPCEIESLAQLVSLNLSFCTQMSSLPAEIGRLSNLQHMNMEGGYAIFDDSVPSEIGLCYSLQSLVLSDTHILSLPRLSVKLAACVNLQILALDHNDDLQVEEYPEEIMLLPKLTTLSMRKYERQSWSVLSTRNIARMQEEATQLRLSRTRNLNIIL